MKSAEKNTLYFYAKLKNRELAEKNNKFLRQNEKNKIGGEKHAIFLRQIKKSRIGGEIHLADANISMHAKTEAFIDSCFKIHGEGGIRSGGLAAFHAASAASCSRTRIFLVRIPPLNLVAQKKMPPASFLVRTERVGFEPTCPCGQTVFKTASL